MRSFAKYFVNENPTFTIVCWVTTFVSIGMFLYGMSGWFDGKPIYVGLLIWVVMGMSMIGMFKDATILGVLLITSSLFLSFILSCTFLQDLGFFIGMFILFLTPIVHEFVKSWANYTPPKDIVISTTNNTNNNSVDGSFRDGSSSIYYSTPVDYGASKYGKIGDETY